MAEMHEYMHCTAFKGGRAELCTILLAGIPLRPTHVLKWEEAYRHFRPVFQQSTDYVWIGQQSQPISSQQKGTAKE